MTRSSGSRIIRKRARKFHKFQPILSRSNGCGTCDACMEQMQAQVDRDRPGHVWAVRDGRIVYLEDKVAEAMLARPLNDHEVAVHKNGNPLDNRSENIEIVVIPDLGTN